MSRKTKGDGDSAEQKHGPVPLSETVRGKKKTSTPGASDRTDDKGGDDKNRVTSNKNLAQGEQSDVLRTTTSCFDPVWNAFSQHTDGSLQWIPKQIVAIGEDFHSKVGDVKVKTTLYKVRWQGYEKKDDSWESITHRHPTGICYHGKSVKGITCERS